MSEVQDKAVAEIVSIQKTMKSGDFARALRQTRSVLATHSDHIDALYMQAVCQRYLKQYDAAERTLNQLKALSPEFGRAYQEEGHLLRAQGHATKALTAYQRACEYNPALMASWKAQAELLQSLNAPRINIDLVRAQAERLSKLPQDLVAVTNFLHEKKLMKAEALCRRFLQKHPKNTEAMRLLAHIGEQFGAMEEAEFLLESAVEFEPEVIQLRLDYLQILRKRHKLQAALEQAKWLNERAPNTPMFQTQLAISHMQLGNYETAVSFFQKVRDAEPNNPGNLTSMGHALKTDGQQDAGIEAYQAACKAVPSHGEAYFSLANLKTYEFSDAEMSNMHHQVEGGQLSYRDRIHFLFALGKAYEDRKDYAQSFGFYKYANDLGRQQMRYDADQMTAELRAQIEHCTSELFAAQSGKGHMVKDPIFILGLPRAGSTLLEQIIASHSQVDGTQELGVILSFAHKLRGAGRSTGQSKYPKCLHNLSDNQMQSMGERFIEETQIHRQGAPFFIDKMPNNFRHIGLIHLILPNAKLIDARRHPMACCFSGFKQHFAEGQEFTYGLKQVGQYYRDYVALMNHWDTVLPGKILRVQYEDVVADTETQVRRILDYLDLPFEEACLEFHKNKRSVRTASSEQVRQPIYKSGLEQWRNYEEFLDPLKTALGPALHNYR